MREELERGMRERNEREDERGREMRKRGER